MSYSWTFGDGSSASGSLTPSHTYSLYGTYTATLTATDSMGDVGRSTTVTVKDVAPTVTIGGPYSGTAGMAVVFAGSGSEPSSQETTSLTYLWNFGDARPVPRKIPRMSTPAPGSYSVSLKVTDASGLSTSASTTASVVADPPTVSAAPAKAATRGVPSSSAVPPAAASRSDLFLDVRRRHFRPAAR